MLRCLKALLRLCFSCSCPVRRREHRVVASPSGEPQRDPSQPLAPLQQLRRHHSGSRARGEQEEEQAHEPKSVKERKKENGQPKGGMVTNLLLVFSGRCMLFYLTSAGTCHTAPPLGRATQQPGYPLHLWRA